MKRGEPRRGVVDSNGLFFNVKKKLFGHKNYAPNIK